MQNFEKMAQITLDTAAKLIAGDDIEKVVNFVELDIVDLSNIDNFTPPEW